MKISAKFLRRQLALLKPIVNSSSIDTARKGHDAIGKLMAAPHKREVTYQTETVEHIPCATVTPKDLRHEGILVYLHGGGYTCGDLAYAKGFGTMLACTCGMPVFYADYRLAPEHPFPAAVEDALLIYDRLLSKGYKASQIILCGESAGGGLIYALCLYLKQMQRPLPAGIIAISPWTDLTLSGASYADNLHKDPFLTPKRLEFFAGCYVPDPEKRKDPLASPLFGDLSFMPPSLLFTGGDEIMADDTIRMHKALQNAGRDSTLCVTPGMWHAYVLYGLEENKGDFDTINQFIDRILGDKRKLRWMRLDNAAKIYPAARRRNWNNRFRLSATLTEDIHPAILQSALDVTVRRFPSMAVRLRRGMFWYYLEELKTAPPVAEEESCPLAPITFDQIRQCGLRVLYYRDRIAVEFYHALTDGTGGLIFLKTLLAEYCSQLYGITVPCENGVLDRLAQPVAAELEDSFLQHSGHIAGSRKEKTAYHMQGTPEPDGFLNATTGMIPLSPLLSLARSYKVSITVLLAAVMILSIDALQKEQVPARRLKPVKVLIPVNLRPLFGSSTLRNFALYSTPGIDPKMGEYTLKDVIKIVHHQLGMENTPQHMAAKMAANVNSERSPLLKIMPLFIKNIAMKLVFNMVGECKSCLSLSNLGAVALPAVMQPYIRRMDFVLGVQASAPYNCGVISWGDFVYINFIRNTKEPALEHRFFTNLRKLGIPVKIESNQR